MAGMEDHKRKRADDEPERVVTRRDVADARARYMELQLAFLDKRETPEVVEQWKRFFAVTGWDDEELAGEFFAPGGCARAPPTDLPDKAFEYVMKIYVVDHMSHTTIAGVQKADDYPTKFSQLKMRLLSCFSMVVVASLPFSANPCDEGKFFEVTFTSTVMFDEDEIARLAQSRDSKTNAIPTGITIHYEFDGGDGFLIKTDHRTAFDAPLNDDEISSMRATINKHLATLYEAAAPLDLLQPLVDLLVRTVDVPPADLGPADALDDYPMFGGAVLDRAIQYGLAAPLH